MDPAKYSALFSQRLSQLRIEANISARDMSLCLSQSESYINKIENHKALPSMAAFFSICEFLDVKPKDFFDFEVNSPKLFQEFLNELRRLSPMEQEHVLLILKDLNIMHSRGNSKAAMRRRPRG